MQNNKTVGLEDVFMQISFDKKSDLDYADDLEAEINKYKEANIETLFGQNNETILRELLNSKPEEEGGLVALSGFYFQMLVFIEYIIEMIDGKWSFLALEYHDDIVAGNEQEKLIRFVQVKTSKQATIRITDSNLHMYNRKTSKQKGKLNGKVRNNSWIDKLFHNLCYVKDLGLKAEFDIVADYSIYSTKDVDINIYNEPKRNKGITDEDALYTRLVEPCFGSDGELIKYEQRYDKSLKELLSQLCFVQKSKINDYKSSLCNNLSERLGKGIKITYNDLNWLVGELISKCAKRENSSILFLKKEEVEGYRQALKKRAVDSARPTVYNSDATELLNKAMQSILNRLSDCNPKTQLAFEMSRYKDLLLESVDENNTLQSLIHRFNEGQKPLFGDNDVDYSDDLNSFLRTSILLFLIHDKFFFSEKFQTLLIKDASKGDEKSRIGFFNLGLELDKDEGLERIEMIINSSPEEEQLEMLWRSTSLYTIFHGEAVDLTGHETVEINTSFRPVIEKLDTTFKSTEVTPVIKILHEKPLLNLYMQLRKSSDYQCFKNKVENQWNIIRGVNS